MRPTLRLENPIDTSRTLSARRSWASCPGAGGFGWRLAVLGCLAAPGSGAGAEPLLEGRVLLSSGAPAAGARVRLFADLGRSLRATTDESGYFALPLNALRKAAPLPARLQLGQNYPNPFNPSTIIPYQLPAPARVRLEVFNILGQRVATLVDGERPAGFHTAAWDATDASGRGVASGVYLYRLLGGGERLTRSMVLLDGPVVAAGGGGSGGAADPWGGGAGADAGSFGGADSWSGAAGTADGFASAGHPPGSAAGGAVSEGAADPSDKPAGARGAGPEKWAPAGGAASGGASAAGPTGGTGAGFEGVADPSGRTGGVGAAGFGAWASARGEGKLYGLTISGPGLVPWVDPAFRVGGGPVEIQVETVARLPRGKVASGGLLGDVNRDGQVDLADALLVASYSEDPTLSLANGDITLGDVNGDGQVDLADARLIEAYHADPSDPSLPEGIGAPVAAADAPMLYWTDAEADRIRRAHLDGSGVEDVVDSGLVNPRGLAVDSAAGKLYWTDYGSDKIQRSNFDGSQVEDLVTTGLRIPLGLALDAGAGKLYWTDNGTDRIQRANLDGSQVEDLVTGLQTPLSLAVDAAGGKLYWSDSGADKIQRANLDGTEVEDLITAGLELPRGLAVDAAGGKFYWTDNGSDKIQRSNLDGSQVEELVTTGLHTPRGLALDPAAGKLYWTDSGTGKIQRANLDASEVEDLVTEGLQTSQAIALDLGEGRMYWTDYGTDKIQRANLDGSQVEDLVTSGLKEPYGLTLGAGLPAQVLKVEGEPATLNLAGRFRDPEGGALTLTVSSSDEGVAAATLADSVLTISPVTPGRVTVAVTARDEGGRAATLPVAVTVYPANRPPVAKSLADRKIRIGSPDRVDLKNAFTDPDALTYTAASSNEAVATTAVEGTGLLITPRKTGQTWISVTARDPKGLEASLSFKVTVEPKPPPRPPSGSSGGGDGDGGSGSGSDGGGNSDSGGGGTPPPPPPPPRPPPPPPPPPPPANNRDPAFDDGSSTTRTVAENTRANQNIQHPVRATDPDGHRLTYRLSGTDETRFTVVSGSGQLRTRSGVAYDYETTDRYEVTLEADDTYDNGTDVIDVTVHVADVDEPPQAPARPRVESASSTSLTVTWTEPANTGPGIDGYDVQYRTGSGSFLPWLHDGDGTTATITGLDVNTRYEVQVRATNDEGTGAWSSSGRGATSTNQRPVFDETAPARSLAENTPGGQDVGKHPIRATDPEGRAVTYSLTGGDTDQFSIVPGIGQLQSRTGVDYNYEVRNRYSVTVEAQDDQGGRATIAVTIDVTDDDNERPGQPDPPSVTASTLRSLSVRWTEPDNPGPPITDYNVQYREGSSGAFTAAAHDGARTTTTIANLASDTSYEIQVQATSDEGTSQWSPSGNGRTVANQAPTFSEGSSTTRRLAENTTGAHNVGNPITATDGDGGTLRYLLGGTDRTSFKARCQPASDGSGRRLRLRREEQL